MESRFLSLFILCLIAMLIPIMTNKLKVIRIPEVIAEMLAGIIIGKSGLNLIEDSSAIEFIALFGFSFLMFLSGLEIDISSIKYTSKNKSIRCLPNLLHMCLLIFLLIILLSYLLSNIFIYPNFSINPLLTAAIFSTTSLGVVLPTLKEKKFTKIPLGQAILLLSIIADLFTMLMIPVIMHIITGNSNHPLTGLILLPAFFVLIFFLWKRFKNSFRRKSAYLGSQLEVRAAIALMLMFITLSELVNIEIVIGAFISGILFSMLFKQSREKILSKLDIVGYSFFIPVFFINIGAKLNLQATYDLQLLNLLPLLFVIGLSVKLIPSLLLKRYFSMKEAIASGFLLSSNLSLTIVISYVAWSSGVINESIYFSFLLYAILSSIISPIVFTKILS